MTFSRADADAIRDAIQDLLFFGRHRPASPGDERELAAAWQTIDRLTAVPVPIPGVDAAAWTYRLRKAAWAMFRHAKPKTGAWPNGARDCLIKSQDALRVFPTPADTSNEQENPPRRRGRKRHCNWQKDHETAVEWERSKDAGIAKKPLPATRGFRPKS